MSRSKPYDRRDKEPRNVDGQWTHDLHAGGLSERLTAKGGATSTARGSSLLDRIGGAKGKELLPDSASRSKLHGFGDVASTSSANSGVELLPSDRNARPTRGSRPRGNVEPGQRALVASSLAALLPNKGARRSLAERESSASSSSLSIMGAAKSIVRVERLARGTTAEDVQSTFSHAPILSARLTSGRDDRTATVELEIADRSSADALVREYDGVMADGERLRLTLLRSEPARQVSGLSSRMNGGERRVTPAKPPSSGKMYSDRMDAEPIITMPDRQPSLAARLGRR